jgi:hypothetical protein
MERNTCRSLVLAGVILIAAAFLLATVDQPEDCSLRVAHRPHVDAVAAASAPTPTLAPPQKVVLVRVEADKSDIEVGWAEN